MRNFYIQSGMQICICAFLVTPVLSNGFLTWGSVARLLVIAVGLFIFLLRMRVKECSPSDINREKILPILFAGIGLFIAVQFDASWQRGFSSSTAFDFIQWTSLIGLVLLSGFLFVRKKEELLPGVLQIQTADKFFLPIILLLGFLHIAQLFFFRPEMQKPAFNFLNWIKIFTVYVLFSRFALIFEPQVIKRVMNVCLGGFAIVLVLSVWRLGGLIVLEKDANYFLDSGQFAQAADGFTRLVTKNERSLRIPQFGLDDITGQLAEKSLAGAALAAFISGEVISQEAKDYETWDIVDSKLRTFVENRNIENQELRQRGLLLWGEALLHLKKWSDLSKICEIGLSEFPDDVSLHLQAVIAALRLQNYRKAHEHLQSALDLSIDFDLPDFVWFLSQDVRSVNDVKQRLPDVFLEYFPLVSFMDVVNLLGFLDLELVYTAEMIRDTRVPVPVTIRLVSMGTIYRDGFKDGGLVDKMGKMYVNGYGNLIRGWARGYNIATIDATSGEIEVFQSFDTYANKAASDAMFAFIDEIPDGKIVLAMTFDEASAALTKKGFAALKMIGATDSLYSHYENRYAWAHAVVGIKGAAPGQVLEVIDSRYISIALQAGNVAPAWNTMPNNRLRLEMSTIGHQKERSVLFLSGLHSKARIALWVFENN